MYLVFFFNLYLGLKHDIDILYFYHIFFIPLFSYSFDMSYTVLTGVEGNINYIRSTGDNITNVARKHRQYLFCYIKNPTKIKNEFENTSMKLIDPICM